MKGVSPLAAGRVARVMAFARVIPKRWRDALYRLLSHNRYRWFGRRSVCHVPSVNR